MADHVRDHCMRCGIRTDGPCACNIEIRACTCTVMTGGIRSPVRRCPTHGVDPVQDAYNRGRKDTAKAIKATLEQLKGHIIGDEHIEYIDGLNDGIGAAEREIRFAENEHR